VALGGGGQKGEAVSRTVQHLTVVRQVHAGARLEAGRRPGGHASGVLLGGAVYAGCGGM
jgi:hypothetical protein